jgi:hypothetical protein
VRGQLTYTSYRPAEATSGGWQVKDRIGDLDQATVDALVSRIGKLTDLGRDLPKFPTSQQLAAMGRRFAYSRFLDGAAMWHGTAAGVDGSGRTGNTFSQAAYADGPNPTGGRRPIEYWRSPSWLTPWGPTQVRDASTPATDFPVPGGVVTRQEILDFIDDFDAPNNRLDMVPVLVDALVQESVKGRPVLLGIGDQEQAALWIGSVCLFFSPVEALRVGFSLLDSKETAVKAWERGADLICVPAGELAGASAALDGALAVDVDWQVEMGPLGGRHQLPGAASVVVGRFGQAVGSVLVSEARGDALFDALDGDLEEPSRFGAALARAVAANQEAPAELRDRVRELLTASSPALPQRTTGASVAHAPARDAAGPAVAASPPEFAATIPPPAGFSVRAQSFPPDQFRAAGPAYYGDPSPSPQGPVTSAPSLDPGPGRPTFPPVPVGPVPVPPAPAGSGPGYASGPQPGLRWDQQLSRAPAELGRGSSVNPSGIGRAGARPGTPQNDIRAFTDAGIGRHTRMNRADEWADAHAAKRDWWRQCASLEEAVGALVAAINLIGMKENTSELARELLTQIEWSAELEPLVVQLELKRSSLYELAAFRSRIHATMLKGLNTVIGPDDLAKEANWYADLAANPGPGRFGPDLEQTGALVFAWAVLAATSQDRPPNGIRQAPGPLAALNPARSAAAEQLFSRYPPNGIVLVYLAGLGDLRPCAPDQTATAATLAGEFDGRRRPVFAHLAARLSRIPDADAIARLADQAGWRVDQGARDQIEVETERLAAGLDKSRH